MGRRDMQDVELAGGEADESTGAGTVGPAGPRRGGRRWWWAASAVVVVAVVVGTAVGADRGDRGRLADLAGTPELLAPLDGAVTDLWRSGVSLWPGVTESGGQLVGVENRPGGNVGVVALDPVTGATLWQAAPRPRGTSDAGTTCALPDPPSPAEARAAVVVCLVADRTSARLLVIDSATGVVSSDTPTDPGAAIAAIGTDLVVGHVDADGRVRVTRTDPLGRTPRWAFSSPTTTLRDSFGRQDLALTVRGDLVVVGAAGASWVLSGEGALLHTWTADPTTVVTGRVEAVGAGPLITEPVTAADGGPGTRVVDLVTGHSFTASGTPVRASPDDGSLAGMVLVQPSGGGALLAYDVTTGQPLWRASGTAGRGVMVLDRRVIRADADSLESIDGRTGEQVWAVPVGQTAQSTLFSDGRLVLLAQPDGDRGIVLVAHGLDDGRVRWESDIADDQYLVTVGGRLYGLSNRETVALGVR
ncbi:MAG: PQQ-binding-like beta-propeller repeat protein [Cellulomonas sp.]